MEALLKISSVFTFKDISSLSILYFFFFFFKEEQLKINFVALWKVLVLPCFPWFYIREKNVAW